MKLKKFLSVMIAGALSLSGVITANADTVFSNIKKNILLESDGEYSDEFDTNSDGRVNVFDLCRIKRDILDPAEYTEPLFSLGSASADLDEKMLYIPIVMRESDFDITSFSMTFNYDVDYFDLSYLNDAEVSGSWRWSHSPVKGYSMVEFTGYDSMKYGGAVFIAELEIKAGTPRGDYDFYISDISAAEGSGSDARQLSEKECPPDSYVYTITIDENIPSVTPPVTDPPVTEPPVTVPPIDPPPSSDLSEENIYNAMIALKAQYPEGMPWTNANGYSWRGGIYSTGYGCAGFAFMLSDAAFGDLPARMIYDADVYSIRVGDILRVNDDTHSVIVLQVTGDGVVLAEGNYNSSVHWGRKMSWAELKSTLTYVMTRYPE